MSMSSPPPLTIGLPVYNGERYLGEALDSLAAQTFTDYRVVISDNASSDGTEEICRDRAESDDRIRYIRRQRNMGGAWNFSIVASEAESSLFKWMAHDDLMAPSFLRSCVEVMQSAPDEVILAYPRTLLIDERGEVIEPFEDCLDLRDGEPHRRLRQYLDNYEMSNPVFGVFRTAQLLRSGLLGSYASADKVMIAELAMIGQFWEISDRLFLRRAHEGMSLRANVTPEEIAAWFDPNEPHPVTMTRSKLFVEYLRSINNPRIGLKASERLRCVQALIASGGLHEARVIGGEMKRELKIRTVRAKRRILSS